MLLCGILVIFGVHFYHKKRILTNRRPEQKCGLKETEISLNDLLNKRINLLYVVNTRCIILKIDF